jgi:hypothetical protein
MSWVFVLAYNSRTLEKIGYLVKPGLFGFDDCISAIRAHWRDSIPVFIRGWKSSTSTPVVISTACGSPSTLG